MREGMRVAIGSIGIAAALLLGSGAVAIAEPVPPDLPTASAPPNGAGAGGDPAPGEPDSATPETADPEATDPEAPAPETPQPQEPDAAPTSAPVIKSWKTDVTVGMDEAGAFATVRENIALAPDAAGEPLDYIHVIRLAPLPGADPAERIAEVSAVAVVDGQELPAKVDVRFGEITADGDQPVSFIMSAPDSVGAAELTYKLSYIIVDPLVPFADDPDRILMTFTIGSVAHPHPIQHYAADFKIEPPLSDALAGGEVGCAVVRADDVLQGCQLDGTNTGFSIVSDGTPLERDEFVRFEAVLDLAALPDALEEQERKDRPDKPSAESASLDAPEWTRFAAGGGLAALGAAGLIISMRRQADASRY